MQLAASIVSPILICEMKRHWIEYCENQVNSKLTYWVHKFQDADSFLDATAFDPPRQRPIPAKGYPKFHVEFDGFTFVFSSLDEIRHCIDTLS